MDVLPLAVTQKVCSNDSLKDAATHTTRTEARTVCKTSVFTVDDDEVKAPSRPRSYKRVKLSLLLTPGLFGERVQGRPEPDVDV